MKTINDIRAKFGNGPVYGDPFANKAAEEYATFLLDNQENEETFKKICENNMIFGDQKVLIGYACLEEDVPCRDKNKMDEFMDAHGLLLELQYELGEITKKNVSHFGIGFAENNHEVKVVELLSEKNIMISHLGQSEDGGVELKGIILNPTVGLYAARIISKANNKKDVALVGPSAIQIDKSTHKFVIQI